MQGFKWLMMLTLCCTSGLLQAQYYYQPEQRYRAVPPVQQAPGPDMVLQHGLQKLMTFVSREQMASPEETMLFLEKEISPYFDFDYMSQWVGSGRWARMAPAQRQQMSTRLRQMFLTTLSQKLTKFGGQGFKVMRPRFRQGGEVIVPVAVQNPGGYPAKLNFRFYRSSAGWKVFDVSANGSSALVYYRQYFNQMQQQAPHRRMISSQ